MAQTTVKQLASEVGIPVERLITRLAEAGISASTESDGISDEDKLKLLRHLRDSGGSSSKSAGKLGTRKSGSVSLRRRSTSELKVNTGRGATSGRTVSVEVRKRRTYASRAEQAEQAEEDEAPQEQAHAAEAEQVAEQDRAAHQADEQTRRE
jgi:translation initiation factor IF-2